MTAAAMPTLRRIAPDEPERPAMTAREIEYAVVIVASSRKTHVEWARYRRNGGSDFEGGGDLRFHEKCIRRYDHVLRILNLALFEATEVERWQAYDRLRALR